MRQSDEFIVLRAEEIPDGVQVTWGACFYWFVRDSSDDRGFSHPKFEVSQKDSGKMKKYKASTVKGTYYVRASDVLAVVDDEDLWE